MPLAEYTFEYNGLVMDSGESGYDVESITGLGMPDGRGIEVPRIDSHGAFPTRENVISHRVIDLEIGCIGTPGDEQDAVLTALNQAFQASTDPIPFRFNLALGWGRGVTSDDTRRVYAACRRRAMDLRGQTREGRQPVVVQLVCYDPRVYSDELQGFSIGLAEAAIGRTYNQTYNKTYGAAESGTKNAHNYGNFNTPPVATIHGPVVSPRIEHVGQGRQVEFDLTVVSGDFLEIDFDARSVLLNGTASRYSTLVGGSQWFELTPGDNTIRFAAGTFDAGASMDFRWRSAWM